MEPASRPSPEWTEAPDEFPQPTGVFQVAEKLEKRTCALCPKDLECSVLYFARSENIAAHENCLLYSSALVECEDHDPCNHDRNFDVEAVKKEINRGRRLKCTFCRKRGATVGCDEKSCSKNYHFFCAKNDRAVLQSGSEGIYKVFCQQHDPSRGTQYVKRLSDVFHPHYNQKTASKQAHFSRVKRKRRGMKSLSTGIPIQLSKPITLNRPIKQMPEEDGRHTDTIVKVAFLKKCKEAGLLNDLFEEILDKLHLIQERLMDETTSESDYEEIGTSLFDCRLFEDTFVNFQAALENKIHQFEEKEQQMKEEIELLHDLKQTLCSVQENRDLSSSSTSLSSLSS
ncbi:PHD finger protein 11 isoform X4 [Rousettus aegyptiacus]|uniref:PHD finger protein 11 n=1 Tax=Rousettus aegyptiacus TaxID=9407 RepID=A0A7J8DYW5_ROUAE|nr:PHD finger protein 11 isoform X4 [Rousettus aegyptiacus]KAF6428261.1 PHD finger protein 11 [Rousettus aegyptiacus]